MGDWEHIVDSDTGAEYFYNAHTGESEVSRGAAVHRPPNRHGFDNIA